MQHEEETQGQLLVTIDARYMHYKQLEYTVIGLTLCEEDNESCAIYRAEYGDHIAWIRPVASWIEKVRVSEARVTRFTQVVP